MRWKKQFYVAHRWLALIISLQLLAWSVGGFTFSILDIDNVHGDWERNFDPPPQIDWSAVRFTPAEAVERLADTRVAGEVVARVGLRTVDGRPAYEVLNAELLPIAVVDAASGEVTRRINPTQAGRAALSDFVPLAELIHVRLIESDPPLEFRGKPLPAYRVVLDHPKQPHIYVSAVTGDVVTRRNRPWRIFDFFWMLHIMDYRQRDDFNHPLLTGMSILAILTSASGLLLWTLLLKRRGRSGSDSRFGTIQIFKP